MNAFTYLYSYIPLHDFICVYAYSAFLFIYQIPDNMEHSENSTSTFSRQFSLLNSITSASSRLELRRPAMSQ